MTLATTLRASATPSSIGLGEGVHSRFQRWLAFAICVVMAGIALLAIRFGAGRGPESTPFVPIVATVWALADLMTAFLLLAQFWVNGTTFLTVLAAVYAFSGLLTCPYVFAFPGVFYTGTLDLPDQQISIWLWAVWHIAFPTVVAIGALCDPQLARRTVSRAVTRNVVWLTVGGTLIAAGTLTAVVFGGRAALPHFVVNGHLQTSFTHVMAPAIAALDFFSCCLLLRRGSMVSTLHLWLFVAMFTALLDGVINATAQSRYSYGWYAGKLETVVAASVVLAMLLTEVTGLYRTLAEMGTIDTLTHLFNRRAFEDHLRLVLNHAQRRSSGLGLLVVDVDYFKGYNEAYGHAGGDECLRRLAAILRSAATRPLDHVSRYGGEEFVVLVPETPRDGALAVARRILERVQSAGIPYAASALGHVTVSVGVAYIADARYASGDMLFEIADRALYAAKASGRNGYTIDDYTVSPPKAFPLRRDPSGMFGM